MIVEIDREQCFDSTYFVASRIVADRDAGFPTAEEWRVHVILKNDCALETRAMTYDEAVIVYRRILEKLAELNP